MSVPDVNQFKMGNVVLLIVLLVKIFMKVKPDCIITTGAAPGYFSLVIAKIFDIKTIWLDSIANADEISLSGRNVKRFADLYLTQWEHLAGRSGSLFKGTVF